MLEKRWMMPYRVLDLCNEKGFFCGRILGDLGCDVIQIAKPGDDASRNAGSFHHKASDREETLFWLAYNANKRSVTLNIESTSGKEIFKRLAQKADVVIESSSPGYMTSVRGYLAF